MWVFKCANSMYTQVCLHLYLHKFLFLATQATVMVSLWSLSPQQQQFAVDYSPSRPGRVLSVKTTMPSN